MSALEGVRVVDFGHYVAGPVTGMLLADQGADVIKVDPPGGPVFDTPANRTWNRGKRSICLDLRNSGDAEVARQLVQRADVVIENFRPGVMGRFGLGESAMRSENPQLIYVSLPGFATSDARAWLPAWEGVIFAATDVLRPISEYREMIQSLHRPPVERSGNPVFTSEPIASMYAALLAATASVVALNTRKADGRGQRIEVPLFDAMLQAIGIFGMSRLPFEPIRTPVYSGWNHQYRCADGRWVHVVLTGAGSEDFCSGAGREDLIARGLTRPGLVQREGENEELTRELTDLFRTRTAEEWEELFVKLEIPGAACRSTEEWLSHPQATSSDLLEKVHDPVLGPMTQPGLQVKLSASPGAIRGPAPEPDEHRSEILNSLREPTNWLDAPSQASGPTLPFEGLRVLDLCIVLAGPTCGRTFAELGADVIKVDPPGRPSFPYHLDVNRGKRSILLDLKKPRGKDVLWSLIERADIVVENFRPGAMERLGFGFDAVHGRNPRAVYVSLNAYGDTGPWSHLPGYEELAEALTGMQVRFGGTHKPTLWPFGVVCDYGTGFAGAFGAALALLERTTTGAGQHVTSALARTACTLQSMHLQDYEGKVWEEPCGPEATGYGPLQRLYRCRDGWIFVGAKNPANIAAVVGGGNGNLEEAISRWCGSRDREQAITSLGNAGAGIHRLEWLNGVVSSPEVVERGLSVSRDHALGLLRTSGPGPWYSASRTQPGRPASLPGQDAKDVLSDIGMADELDELVRTGVVGSPGFEEG